MVEVCIAVSEDLKDEFKGLSNIELSILFAKFIRERLSRAEQFKRIVSKSKLSQEQADELADEISKSLSKRYTHLSR